MNSFLVGSAVYLFLTLAGLPTPYREIITLIAWSAELLGNYQNEKLRKLKSLVSG